MINILYKEHEEYISKTAIVLDKHREHEVIKDLEWYFIELPKFEKTNSIDINDIVNQWLVFISNDRRYIDMAITKNKVLKEKRGLEIGEKRGLEIGEKRGLEIGEKRGLESGEKRGEKRGKKLGEQNIIKSLFKNNMSPTEIAEKTGIKLAEILKIVNN